jgi:putative GTP pyrophosphokinase
MDMDIEKIRNEYIGKLKKIDFLIDQVKFVLNQGIDRNKIKIHSITDRIKSIDSFLKKMRRENIEDPFNDIHDLIGLRVICLFLSDLELVGAIIEKEFNIFQKDDKVNNGSEETPGYTSIRYTAKLKESIHFAEYKDLNNYPFEIQVRTIVQDAWASTSHYLRDKQDSSLSPSLKEDYRALSRLFYDADSRLAKMKMAQAEPFLEKPAREE